MQIGERQHTQPADISGTQKISKFGGMSKNWLSTAILNSDLLHGTVHHPTAEILEGLER